MVFPSWAVRGARRDIPMRIGVKRERGLPIINRTGTEAAAPRFHAMETTLIVLLGLCTAAALMVVPAINTLLHERQRIRLDATNPYRAAYRSGRT